MKIATQGTFEGSILVYRYSSFRLLHRSIMRLQQLVILECRKLKHMRKTHKCEHGNLVH